MMLFLEIYFVIGLICALIDIYVYWIHGTHGYTKKDKIKGTVYSFLFWPLLVIGFIGLWLIGLKIEYDKKKSNKH